MHFADKTLEPRWKKVETGERLSFEDGSEGPGQGSYSSGFKSRVSTVSS